MSDKTSNFISKAFLVSPSNVLKLEQLSKSQSVSVNKALRLAIDAYNPIAGSQLESEALINQNLTDAVGATNRANHKVEAVLFKLSQRS